MATNIVIRNNITECENFLREFGKVPSVGTNSSHVSWFQVFCRHITSLIESISESHKKNKIEESIRNTLLFNLSQLLSYLFLVIRIFEMEYATKLTILEARYFVKKQLQCCFKNIEETLTSTSTNTLNPFGSFLNWMDSALRQITEICYSNNHVQTSKYLQNIKELIEEILCHSMSVAQVTDEHDFKIIKGSSQMVLESFDSLSYEINKSNPNASMVSLYADSCSDKLCALEQKVNNSVLRLTLRVFSEYTKPLQRIGLSLNDFENLVADFDLHVDRIMQIGLFALSCSTNVARGIQIKCCMANLEALETELVPALNAVLCEDNIQNRSYATILKEFWITRANLLKHNIFLIIDPFAFCQIAYEENKHSLLKIQGAVTESDKKLVSVSVQKLMQTSKVLQIFLSVVSDKSETEAQDIKEDFSDFNIVIHEVQSAKDYFLSKGVCKADDFHRLLKRCKILLNITKRLRNCFAEGNSNIEKRQSEVSEPVPNNESASQIFETNNPFLAHIITKGKGILKDHNHSVLYQKSHIENAVVKASQKGTSVSVLKYLRLRHLSFMSGIASKNDNTTSLQITDILNELTTMSTSFDALR